MNIPALAPCPGWLLQAVRASAAGAEPCAPAGRRGGTRAAVGNGQASGGIVARDAYARAALAREVAMLAGCGRGSRNQQLFKSAANLQELVNGGRLSADEVETALLEACGRNGLVRDDGAKSVRDTVASARRKVGGRVRMDGRVGERGCGGVGGREYGRNARNGGRVGVRWSDGDGGVVTGGGGNRKKEEAGINQANAEDTALPDDNPYEVHNGCIVFALDKHTKQGRDTFYSVVCDFVACIVEDIRGEGGESVYKIEGRTPRGQVFAVEIDAARFNDPRALTCELSAAAGAQFPVRAGMEKHLPSAVKKLTDDGFSRSYRFVRTGWGEVEGQSLFLVPGQVPPRVEVHLPRKLPYSFEKVADLELGLKALENLLRAQRASVSAVALAFALTPPLALPAGWRNERAALFIAGRTGSLKSSWSSVLMCLYGAGFLDETNLVKWGEGATRNAIMNFATHCHDLPLLIDNYKSSTGGGSRDFTNLIHNILEGGEKDRLNRDARMRDSKPVFCWPLLTGEDVPDSDAASLARVLVVPFTWNAGADNPALTQAQLLSPHLNAVGRAWVNWVASDEGRQNVQAISSGFAARRALWMVTLRQMRNDMVNINRVASNLAINELAWEIALRCPDLRRLLERWSEAHQRGLAEIAAGMASYTAESLEASRYLEALRQLLATERFILVPRFGNLPAERTERVLGWEDEKGAYLLPDLAYRAANDLLRDSGGLGGISKHALHKQLDSLGVLAPHTGNEYTTPIRCSGKVQRVLHVVANVFGGDE